MEGSEQVTGLIKYMPHRQAMAQTRIYADEIVSILVEAFEPLELDAVLAEVARRHSTEVSEAKYGLQHLYSTVEIKQRSALISLL